MSVRTTNLGPRVSFTTTNSDAGPVHVYGDSNGSFDWAGTSRLSSVVIGGQNATAISNALYSTWTVDPGSLAQNVTSLLSRAVTGVNAGDVILGTVGSSLSVNFNTNFYCESNGSVTYELGNVGGATQDLSVLTVRIIAFRSS